jgi:hypothetical protein
LLRIFTCCTVNQGIKTETIAVTAPFTPLSSISRKLLKMRLVVTHKKFESNTKKFSPHSQQHSPERCLTFPQLVYSSAVVTK